MDVGVRGFSDCPQVEKADSDYSRDALYHAADPDDEEARDGMLTLSSPAKSG